MKTFKIHIVKDKPIEGPGEKIEKDVIINAPSCSEACVLAMRSNTGFTFTRWEEVVNKS